MKIKRLLERNNVLFEKVTMICDVELGLLSEIRENGGRIITLTQDEIRETTEVDKFVTDCIVNAAQQAGLEHQLIKGKFFLLEEYSDDTVLSALKYEINWITQYMKESGTNSGNFLVGLIRALICQRLQVLVYEFLRRTSSDKILDETFPSNFGTK